MSIIAIITARGGSKRIPKKNIRPFCSLPIISYSIKAALESKIFDEVMVSTDSEEIKAVAEGYGASVPFLRSKANSNDYAVTADVLYEVLTAYKGRSQHGQNEQFDQYNQQHAQRGKEFDNYCCIYPTAPFITSSRLEDAYNKFLYCQPQSLIAVVKYSFPPQRGFVIAKDGFVKYQYPEYELTRSQDLEPIYHDCGQFYFGKVRDFMQLHTLIMPRTLPYVLSEEEVQDIDTEIDWEIAEAKYSVFVRKYNLNTI